jgi:hypothetical protein
VDRFRQAIGYLRPVFKDRPQDSQFRQHLSSSYDGLARSLCGLKRADEAAEVTRERVKLWPGKANELYDAACTFSLCVPVGGDAPRRQALADEAMATLRAAVSAGYTNGALLSRDPDLDSLRGRDDFRQLVLQLLDSAMPADPFAPSL